MYVLEKRSALFCTMSCVAVNAKQHVVRTVMTKKYMITISRASLPMKSNTLLTYLTSLGDRGALLIVFFFVAMATGPQNSATLYTYTIQLLRAVTEWAIAPRMNKLMRVALWVGDTLSLVCTVHRQLAYNICKLH